MIISEVRLVNAEDRSHSAWSKLKRRRLRTFHQDMELQGMSLEEDMSEIECLRKDNARLKEQVNDCMSRLLELSGNANQVTDVDIQQSFEGLHNVIDSAVERFLIGEGLFRCWDTIRQGRIDEICKIVNVPGDLLIAMPSTTPVNKDGFVDEIAWLGGHEFCDHLVTSLVVWRFLERHIFREKVLPVGSSVLRGKNERDKKGDLMEDIFELLVNDSRETSKCDNL
jgi:hypothetical protein